jgi:hypothetical protein
MNLIKQDKFYTIDYIVEFPIIASPGIRAW